MNDVNRLKRIFVFVSGEGTNLQAIAQAIALKALPATIEGVICNRPHAKAIHRARDLGLPVHVIDHQAYSNVAAFEQQIIETLNQYHVDVIVLAGFMRQLSGEFVERYEGRILNLHPSLLPKFPGLNPYAKALAAGEKEHGSTVHFVTEELDQGPIIAQVRIPIGITDDEASLKKRLQVEEHRLYPLVLSWVANDRLSWNDGKPMLDGFELPVTGIQVPDSGTTD